MKTRKVLMIISLLQIIILSIILVMGIIEIFTFEPDGNDHIFGHFEYWFRGFLMILICAGVFSATMVMISLRSYSLMPVTERNGINKVFLILSITANILFYPSFYFIVFENRRGMLLVPLIWIIIQICSFVLLIVSLVINEFKRKG